MRTLLTALLLLAPLQAETLESVLNHLDEAAASFQCLTAQIRMVKHTAIVDADDVSEGTIWVKRVKPHVSRLLIEFTVPDTFYVALSEKKGEIYRPKIATVEEYDVSKFRHLKDQLWLLSFGTAGRDLTMHYRVRLEGSESVGSTAAVKLELVPNSKEMLQQFPRLEMWIDTGHWQPVQQKFYDITPGDFRISTFTDIKLNVRFPDSRLEIHAPGAKRVHPQR